jgi:hypothetical protein
MPTKDQLFEDFLQESFGEAVTFRELRLSSEELAYVEKMYPKASIKRSLTNENTDGKAWYEINLSPINDESENATAALESIQQENKRLKQEVEALKQSLDAIGVK